MDCPKEITQVPEVLTREQCSSIIEQTRPFLTPAMIGMSYLRTQHPARLADNYKYRTDNSWTIAIREKAAELAKVDIDLVEPVEVIRYPTGGYYYAHNDGMDRTHTFSVYLSDEYMGGDLFFTNIDALFTKIPVGMGLLFDNNTNMRHECRTVVSGEKWLLTAWVNMWDLEGRKKSGRDPKDPQISEESSIILS